MKRHSIPMTLAGCLLAPLAASAADDAEALREQAIARSAEQSFRGWVPDRPILPALLRGIDAGDPAPRRGVAGSGVFVGVDDATVSTWFLDPVSGVASPGFTGTEVWAAAHVTVDLFNYLIFMVDGSELVVSSNGQPATACCTLSTDGVNPASMVGAAFDPNTQSLLLSRNLSPESIFSLAYSETLCTADPICTMTEVTPTDGTVADLGGLAFDPNTDTLYGTNDDPDLRGLVAVGGDGNLTLLAPYPDSQTDIDGLAFGDGKLYLVIDEPGSIYVYDLATAAYETPLPNPWTTAEIFSGGAFVTLGSADIIFRNGFEPIGP